MSSDCVGADGCQVFPNKQHGSLIGGLRLHELPIVTGEVWAALLLVRGPTEPNDFQYILGPVFQFFKAHDPGSSLLACPIAPLVPAPLYNSFRTKTASGEIALSSIYRAGVPGTTPITIRLPSGQVIKVWPVLGHCEGDLPIKEKLTGALQHGNKHSCWLCDLEGVTIDSAGTVRCVPTHHQGGVS